MGKSIGRECNFDEVCLGSTVTCIQHENILINCMAKQITPGGIPRSCQGCRPMLKRRGVYTKGSR